MSKHSQFYLLADHIKLLLLERQRAARLNLVDDTQDGHISRSLDQLRTGLASLRKEKSRHEQEGEEEYDDLDNRYSVCLMTVTALLT
ncbi:hypothetical protein E4U53_005958 [Claviceps sorghi]|nr:hypothetical protein E4U53_005958 [Claviceps sorghi]